MRKQIVGVKKQIIAKKEEVQQKKSAQQKSKLLLTQVAEKTVRLSSGIEVINILSILEKAVVGAQITSTSFEPQAVQQDEWFMVYPIKLELEGDYKKLLIFINNVLQLSYLVAIEDLNIQKKKDDDRDNLIARILLVVYKNKHTVARDISNLFIHVSERDIFKQEIYRKNLFLWSSKELRFLGLIKQGQMNFGVVSDPLGGVYRVVAGDKIGLNQSEIIAVDKCGITTVKMTENIYRGGKCI